MTTRDTSIHAYHEQKETGEVSRQQQLILDAIRKYRLKDYSLRELAVCSGIHDVSTVSGRVNELKKKGILIENGTRRCRVTGRTIHPVMLKGRLQ